MGFTMLSLCKCISELMGKTNREIKAKKNKSEKILGLGFWAYRGNKSQRRFLAFNLVYLGKAVEIN